MVERCRTRPIAHVAAETGTTRWSASRISFDPHAEGIEISRRTVSRHLLALGLHRRRFIDPNGDSNREPRKITAYRPDHNGKVERYNRMLPEEFLYARTWLSEEQRRDALTAWNIHYDYHRPHGAAAGRPPATRLRDGVPNGRTSYR
ncbi:MULTISPECIES: integrase core domain-containing protein [Streptomyces]|uniref:Integrase core domain-containing protein n=2 Tax=Streptomyces TaxID=1883 RepID=A0ABU2RFF5_9ACTN|nr:MULTISPECIES: integrase core domain-containing protein [unclassified Streptomyces]MBK3592473.1 transposase [Streptomyces sp. MBT51]MDT0427311.1 integrase core domain-containing protein [Streptomyces sp. DSM 41770]